MTPGIDNEEPPGAEMSYNSRTGSARSPSEQLSKRASVNDNGEALVISMIRARARISKALGESWNGLKDSAARQIDDVNDLQEFLMEDLNASRHGLAGTIRAVTRARARGIKSNCAVM